MDEHVKQFYDVVMLTIYRLEELDIREVRKKYLKRAEKEWYNKKKLVYDIQEIIIEVRKQLYRYSMIDSGKGAKLKKYINDFKVLYLNSKVEFSPQLVACEASLGCLMYSVVPVDTRCVICKTVCFD